MNAKAVMEDLQSKGSEKTRVLMAKHGHPIAKTLGVSVADMKAIAKKLKGAQAVALQLYAMGFMEAMYLAGMVADGKAMSKAELQKWAEGASGFPMIESYTVPWVTVENEAGPALAMKWIASKDEGVAAAGWASYAGLVAVRPDESLDLKEVEALLDRVAKEVHGAKNRVRKAMNQFVICVGLYVKPLAAKAKAAARKIGNVSVDVGETTCKIPVALEYIAKVEKDGRAGVKRKTIRC